MDQQRYKAIKITKYVRGNAINFAGQPSSNRKTNSRVRIQILAAPGGSSLCAEYLNVIDKLERTNEKTVR